MNADEDSFFRNGDEPYLYVVAVFADGTTIPALDPRRADLAVAGAILVDTILRRLGADDLTLCDLALREGLMCFRRKLDSLEPFVEEARRARLDVARFRVDATSHAMVEAFGAFNRLVLEFLERVTAERLGVPSS